ncbi:MULTISPECIES: 3-hydroxyacyl-ACP dehydratase FabZ [unclassified Pseudoalteromonas]|uniref:3-hydroxyacyl-ACP dehydratase FabZ n=1 Tax=unclassified Pseudoalteromonas TaxID=194690 RepID=UPI000F647B4A|nr:MULTISPECIES: 3-hydroxyacyl-ACP dehydratase FabZ [unclassified Pseudoalteromonas]RRS06775.1 3-hydroxyacyl-ACP dehydratase FabZ [Pseudoalteromonas sp. J010]RXF02850.1 3-hydroxyacyl-ACP dehydratase FabZ [Pseudoalteromonas sp. PS5]
MITDNLPHQAPFKFADKIIEHSPGEMIVGLKFISHNEPGLQGHFPDEPIFPGVLIIETMAQISGLCCNNSHTGGMLSAIEKAKFNRPVRPGEIIKVTAKLETEFGALARFKAQAHVEDELVAKAELTIVYTD